MSQRALRWFSCVLLACALLGAARWAQAASPDPAPPLVVVAQALFRFSGAAADEAVALPHTWREGRPAGAASGTYRLSFHLDAVPEGGLAARFARVAATRRVVLNGHLVGSESLVGNDHVLPDLIAMPAPMLRVGANELVLEVRYRNGGGLSAADIGAPMAQKRVHERALLWEREVPRSLNMAMMALSLFMLLVWWQRRSEATIGLFGLVSSIGSFRNYMYFAEYSVMPSAATNWLFYCAQVWTLALFAAFVRSLQPDGQRSVLGQRLLLVSVVTLPAMAVVASAFGAMAWMRTLTYPLLLLVGIGSVGLLWRIALRRGDLTHYTLSVAFSCVIGAGLHDHLFQEGILPVTGSYWLPLVMPFALGVYGVMTMSRLVTAVGEAERLNAELEQRVLQRTRALQAANATKTRFLASASHDLRQPIAAIGLMVSLLREQVTAKPLRVMIDRVDEAVASMESMLRGLLDLSRLESGTVRARPTRLALQPLFDAIALHEAETAERKGLRLRFRSTPLAVQADPVLLDQVLRNLVSNAVRYTESGGVLVTARARGADALLLQVWDTGIGMSPEDQAVVFDEFVQVGNAARQSTRGLGLGLSIVRRSTAVMGSPLSLRSVPGRGSCFSLTLPRVAVDRRRRAEAPAAPVSGSPLYGVRILVVEDDAAVREGLSERLQAWGATVQAFDGVASLKAALPAKGAAGRSAFTDLVITDQRLPGASGLVVIELVRQRCGATCAMVVTGDTSPGDLTLLEASGVPVLHKPFRADALLATVQQALASTAIGELDG